MKRMKMKKRVVAGANVATAAAANSINIHFTDPPETLGVILFYGAESPGTAKRRLFRHLTAETHAYAKATADKGGRP